MSKRRKEKYTAFQNLQSAGVDVSKTDSIQFNSGSETFEHLAAKAAVAYLGQVNGYWIDSETELQNGEVDILLWGHESRMTVCVELESGATEAVKRDKLERYVLNQPGIQEMYLLNVDTMPEKLPAILDWVSNEIGLKP